MRHARQRRNRICSGRRPAVAADFLAADNALHHRDVCVFFTGKSESCNTSDRQIAFKRRLTPQARMIWSLWTLDLPKSTSTILHRSMTRTIWVTGERMTATTEEASKPMGRHQLCPRHSRRRMNTMRRRDINHRRPTVNDALGVFFWERGGYLGTIELDRAPICSIIDCCICGQKC